jgi:hypothetical protein
MRIACCSITGGGEKRLQIIVWLTKEELFRNQIINLGWMKENHRAEISGPRPLPSTRFSILNSQFYVSLSEEVENRKEWRLIVQEAKAHPELWLRREGRNGRREGEIWPTRFHPLPHYFWNTTAAQVKEYLY